MTQDHTHSWIPHVRGRICVCGVFEPADLSYAIDMLKQAQAAVSLAAEQIPAGPAGDEFRRVLKLLKGG